MSTDATNLVWRSVEGDSALYDSDVMAFLRTIPSDSVDCVWTDPPYLLSNDGFTCVAGKRVKVNKGDWGP